MFCAIATRDVHEINKILRGHEYLVSQTKGLQKRTALHHAAEHGDPQICRILIESGANINKKDARGKPPLCLAASKGNREICRLLINQGAEISCVNQDSGPMSQFFLTNVSNEMKILIHCWKNLHGKTFFDFQVLYFSLFYIYHIFPFLLNYSCLFISVVSYSYSDFHSEKSLNTMIFFDK